MTIEARTDRKVGPAVPGFWVHNIEESVRFYGDGLGFTVTNEWVHEGKRRWCQLELGGATLMLQEFWKEGEDRNLPDGKVGIGVGICFFCAEQGIRGTDYSTPKLLTNLSRPSDLPAVWAE